MTPHSWRLWQSTVQSSPHDVVQSFMSWHSVLQSFSQTMPQLFIWLHDMSQPSPEHSKKQVSFSAQRQGSPASQSASSQPIASDRLSTAATVERVRTTLTGGFYHHPRGPHRPT